MGLFGVAEILANLERAMKREVIKARVGSCGRRARTGA